MGRAHKVSSTVLLLAVLPGKLPFSTQLTVCCWPTLVTLAGVAVQVGAPLTLNPTALPGTAVGV